MKTVNKILELVDYRVEVLEDGQALATLGITDDDKEAVELAHDQLKRKQAAATLGRKGGASKTPAKAQASRENGRKGGRPMSL